MNRAERRFWEEVAGGLLLGILASGLLALAVSR